MCGLVLKALLDFKQSLKEVKEPALTVPTGRAFQEKPCIAKAPGREATGRPVWVDQNRLEGERSKGQRLLSLQSEKRESLESEPHWLSLQIRSAPLLFIVGSQRHICTPDHKE